MMNKEIADIKSKLSILCEKFDKLIETDKIIMTKLDKIESRIDDLEDNIDNQEFEIKIIGKPQIKAK